MGFVRMPGIEGKVYVPEKMSSQQTRKHDCLDCYACQMCGDDRCGICRGDKSCLHESPSPIKPKSQAPVSTSSSLKRPCGC
jgi:hypothetical protein